MSKILYFFRESINSSRHNLGTTIGGIVTIFLSLLMVGVSILFSNMIGNVTSSFEEQVNIRVYISDEATDEQIASFNQFLEGMKNDEGNLKNITFMDKDAVMEEFIAQTSNTPEIAEQLEDNPLPRTYVLEMRDTELVEDTVAKILGYGDFGNLCDNPDDPSDSVKYGKGTVERLFLVVNIIRYGCVAAIVLLVFISLVFLNNTIRLAILARRKEISIMRLVGASNGFIRGPFIMEGALQALIAAILAIIVISILRATLMPSLENMISFLPLSVSSGTYGMIYIILLVAGLFVGSLGSVIAMRRYLKI